MTALIIYCASFGAAPVAALPESFLLRVEHALELARADIVRMRKPAEQAAERMAGGGRLLAGGNAAFVSELCGRAGGFMQIKSADGLSLTPDDVVLIAAEAGGALPRSLLESGALRVVFGANAERPGTFSFSNYATETDISPTLANAIPGWLFTGELIAALTRLGKMPVLYESIGLYGGFSRMQQFGQQGVYWHENHHVPPVAPGVLANGYVDAVTAMLRRVEQEERGDIDRAGTWSAQAAKDGKRLIMYSMGHLFPAEVAETAIGQVFESAVWNSGFISHTPPDHDYAAGDVLIHIGYQHPPYRLLPKARAAGARVAYVDILRHRDYPTGTDVIWIDPMWPWSDACVAIEGYDVPALAASGVVNGAIAWEIHRVTSESH